ncbi:hypothetical protein LCGC14_1248750 [marine sediment metagenome]|uniref:Terminase large subunit gp17-like C-terminal domain-containing protein n=1 Tax=marine sediment metagenome TaxID=412755 RepID=A0A0F9P7P4_9ZZZZ
MPKTPTILNPVLEQCKEQLKKDTLSWGMLYCPKHFTIESPWFHTEVLDFCNSHRYLSVAAPRESSKSTLLTFLKPAHDIAEKRRHFIVLVMNTYAKAAGALSTIKSEFRNGQLLRQHYGITFEKDSEGDTIFKHPDGFRTRVLCKGHEQIGSVRGEKFGPNRPDLIIGDDLEDDTMVRSRERRENLRNEFDDALIPAGDKKTCQYIFIGTILHDDSLMAKLVSKEEYKEYRKLFYIALNDIDGEEISLWPEKWSVDDLKKIRKNKPSVFAKEYQNDPVSGAMRKFHKEDFRYWTIENLEAILFNDNRISAKYPLRECKAAISCDLAWEEKRESDFGVVVPAFLTPNSDLLIDDYICKKGMRPHEIEEILFSMEERLRSITKNTVPIGWEKAKLEKVMQYLLRQAMRRRNKYLMFKALQWDTDKIQRIVTRLEPRYAQHTIFHRRSMGELEHQLLRFPSGTHDDLPDALQGLVQLLQYPKTQRKIEETKEDEFNWWRNLTIKHKKPERKAFVFGQRGKRVELPAKVAFR